MKRNGLHNARSTESYTHLWMHYRISIFCLLLVHYTQFRIFNELSLIFNTHIPLSLWIFLCFHDVVDIVVRSKCMLSKSGLFWKYNKYCISLLFCTYNFHHVLISVDILLIFKKLSYIEYYLIWPKHTFPPSQKITNLILWRKLKVTYFCLGFNSYLPCSHRVTLCKVSKVCDRSRGWPEVSVFNSFYTKV